MKSLLAVVIGATLLSGCVTKNEGSVMTDKLNDLQKQVNALSVRQQSNDYRVNKLEEAYHTDQTQDSRYCYLNGVKYSQGMVYAGRICSVTSDAASWQIYSHR